MSDPQNTLNLPSNSDPQPDHIRVMRVYVFEGPRVDVERTLSHSLQDGTHVTSSAHRVHATPAGVGKLTIKVATIGQFPEIIG